MKLDLLLCLWMLSVKDKNDWMHIFCNISCTCCDVSELEMERILFLAALLEPEHWTSQWRWIWRFHWKNQAFCSAHFLLLHTHYNQLQYLTNVLQSYQSLFQKDRLQSKSVLTLSFLFNRLQNCSLEVIVPFVSQPNLVAEARMRSCPCNNDWDNKLQEQELISYFITCQPTNLKVYLKSQAKWMYCSLISLRKKPILI